MISSVIFRLMVTELPLVPVLILSITSPTTGGTPCCPCSSTFMSGSSCFFASLIDLPVPFAEFFLQHLQLFLLGLHGLTKLKSRALDSFQGFFS